MPIISLTCISQMQSYSMLAMLNVVTNSYITEISTCSYILPLNCSFALRRLKSNCVKLISGNPQFLLKNRGQILAGIICKSYEITNATLMRL